MSTKKKEGKKAPRKESKDLQTKNQDEVQKVTASPSLRDSVEIRKLQSMKDKRKADEDGNEQVKKKQKKILLDETKKDFLLSLADSIAQNVESKISALVDKEKNKLVWC